MMKNPDTIIGSAATATGSLGLTVQFATSFGSLLIIGINIILALGGLYLLFLRIRKARRELE